MGDARECKPRVLYVDDDDLLAHLVETRLTGIQILRVRDGGEGMAFLRNMPLPELVLLDLHMPQRDGFQVLAEIRAAPALAALPVAIFTTSLWPADRDKAFALGANYFLQKPTDLKGFDDLADILARILMAGREHGQARC
jgi:CheY-like chemotaxis protein